MYDEMLSMALAEAEDAKSVDAMVDDVVLRRSEATDEFAFLGSPTPIRLAAQVAYDVALIRVSTLLGIPVDESGFSYPGKERSRLESALVERGIGLERNTKSHAGQPSMEGPPGVLPSA